MSTCTEKAPLKDGMAAFVSKSRKSTEGMPIHGYMTVTKNKGRRDEQVICKDRKNLLTNAGRDAFHSDLYTGTFRSGSGYNYIGLSADTTSPAAGDTSLAGEITTGGLARARAVTRTHTVGTNTTELSHTFTASATHSGIVKASLFNLASGGIMAHENTFDSVNLADGDTLTITWTITMG